jgi:hypothetical protein
MTSSANVVLQHVKGELGSRDAVYGIVDGHHRCAAVRIWQEKTKGDFKVTPMPALLD